MLGIKLFFAGIFGLAILVGLFGPLVYYNVTEASTYEFDLVAITNSTKTDGFFFLGTGSIEESPAFYFYIRTGTVKRLMYAYAYNSVIDERDGVNPKAIVKTRCDNDEYHCMNGGKWTFIVPSNSIVKTYELDVRRIK